MARLALVVTLALGLSGPALAADEANWPCVQRKVPTLTPAAVWTGPAVEPVGAPWRADAEVADMVSRLSQRRMPIDEAEAEIAAFAGALDAAEAEARATLLFAGLFEVMNQERGEVIEGIERYGRRQIELAAKVREAAANLGALRAAASAEAAAVDAAQTDLEWQTRIFNERRSSLQYVCEVPRFIEQRLFSLGRAISKALKD